MTKTSTHPCPFTATAPGGRLAVYRALSAAPGLTRIGTPDGRQGWLVTDYLQVRSALGDPRVTQQLSPTSAAVDRLLPQSAAALTRHMLNIDGAEHTRLRRLVSTVFTGRRIERLRPRIQQIADELLNTLEQRVAPGEAIDLLTQYASPLPMTVICELVGVPEPDRPHFRHWTHVMVVGSFADADTFAAAAISLVDYLLALIEIRRTHPGDDLLSALLAARDGRDRLREDEVTSMVWLLVLAGHETTVSLIASGIYQLLTHPDQLARLHRHPTLIDTCVEELLRVTSPLHASVPKVATETFEINGVSIAPGDIVVPGLLAANHDPTRIAHPETLDIGRVANPHMAFGHGIHYCLGAPLARLEGRIALASLLTRFPHLTLARPPEAVTWRPGYILNAPTAMPITLTPTPTI